MIGTNLQQIQALQIDNTTLVSALSNTSTAFANALGWAVLQSLWQGLALAAILWCVRLCFLAIGGEQTARSRYIAGIITLFAFISSFVASFLYALLVKFPMAAGSVNSASSAPLAPVSPLEALPILASSSFLSTLVMPLLELFDHTNMIGMIWAFCVGVLALRYCMAYRLTHKLRTEGLSPLPSNWLTVFETLTRDAGVSSSVRCYFSSHVATPITFGFIKPIVLVPTWFFTGLSPQQCEAILLHELAHIARYDYLVNIGQIIIKTILFYHPCTHYICKTIGEDREHACDDFAVSLSKNPESLATALGTIRIRAAQSKGVFVLAANDGNAPIYRRLQRLVGTSEKPVLITSSSRSYATSAALATIIFTALSFNAVQSQAHPTLGTSNDTQLAGGKSADMSKSAKRWFSSTAQNGKPLLDGDAVLSNYYYDTIKLDKKRYLTKVGPSSSGQNQTYIKVGHNWYDMDETDLDKLLDINAKPKIPSHPEQTPVRVTVNTPANIRVQAKVTTPPMPPFSKLDSLEKFVALSIKAIELKEKTPSPKGHLAPLTEQEEFGKEVLEFTQEMLEYAQNNKEKWSVEFDQEFEPITEFIDQNIQREVDKALAIESKKLGFDFNSEISWDGTIHSSRQILHVLQDVLDNTEKLTKKQRREIQKQLRQAERELENGLRETQKDVERAQHQAQKEAQRTVQREQEKALKRANKQRIKAQEQAQKQRQKAQERAQKQMHKVQEDAQHHHEEAMEHAQEQSHKAHEQRHAADMREHNLRASLDKIRTAQHKNVRKVVTAKLLELNLITNTNDKIKLKVKPDRAYLNGTKLSDENYLALAKIVDQYFGNKNQYKLFVFKPDVMTIQHGNMDGSDRITYNYHASEL